MFSLIFSSAVNQRWKWQREAELETAKHSCTLPREPGTSHLSVGVFLTYLFQEVHAEDRWRKTVSSEDSRMILPWLCFPLWFEQFPHRVGKVISVVVPHSPHRLSHMMLVSAVSLTSIFNNYVPKTQRARWTRPTPQPDLVSGATESTATPLKKWEKRCSRKSAAHRIRPRVLPWGLVVGNNKNQSHGNRWFVCRSK